MHAAKIPFTGMMVSSLSVTCIILIAYYIPGNANIIKATFIVIIFKLMFTPHSPPTAYIAVFFQGYMGQLLFHGRRHFTLSAIILSVLALVESAIQRLLVLLILYGNTFWHALDQYVKKLVGGEDRNYSLLLASGYVFLHAAAGILVGTFAVRIVKRSDEWRSINPSLVFSKNPALFPETEKSTKKKKFGALFIILWLLLILLFAQAYIDPLHAVIPKSAAAKILFRSLLIFFSWYLIVAPVIMKLINFRLKSQEIKQQTAVNQIMLLLPEIKYIFTQSWFLSAAEKGLSRAKLFLKLLLVNILSESEEIRIAK